MDDSGGNDVPRLIAPACEVPKMKHGAVSGVPEVPPEADIWGQWGQTPPPSPPHTNSRSIDVLGVVTVYGNCNTLPLERLSG